MKKLFSFVAAVLCAVSASAVVDTLTVDKFTATKAAYTDFSGVTATSNAVYAGNTAKSDKGAIQLRSKNSNSGIVSTTSGGKVLTVSVVWNAETDAKRVLDIYGSNTPYKSAADLYTNATGTKIGSIAKSGETTTFTVEGDYYYVGLRSKSGAMYIDSITIEWDGSEAPEPEPEPEPEEMGMVTIAKFLEAKDDFNIYTLCGTVSDIVMDKNDPTQYNVYGNFNLTDSTGTIYIYGLLTADGEAKKFLELGIEEGDVITLKGSYTEHEGTPQIKNAIFVSKSSGETALEAVRSEEKAEKRVVNGQLVIIRNGVMYNAAGTRME